METTLSSRQDYNIRLLTFFFLYVTFNGVIRKWVLTDSLTSNLLLGGQIGLPLLFLILVRTKPYTPFTLSLLLAYSALLVLMIFNPLAQTAFHGIIGYFLHIGVFFPLFVYFNDRDAFPLERMHTLFLVVIGVQVMLGIIQFLSPTDSIINKYVRDTTDMGGVATLVAVNRVRVTTTFGYIGGATSLLAFFGFLIWGLRLTKGSNLLIAAALIACAVLSPMTGSRGASAISIILVACAFLSTFSDLRNSLALVFLLVIGFFVVTQYSDLSLVGEAYSGLNERIQGNFQNGENETRIIGQIKEIIDFRGNYPLFGTGLGGTYQGAIALFGESIYLKEYGYYEEEPERIILEGGFLLFFVRTLFWIILFRNSRIPFVFGLMLLLLHVFYMVTVYNVFTAFYTVMGLMYLDRSYYLREQHLNPA